MLNIRKADGRLIWPNIPCAVSDKLNKKRETARLLSRKVERILIYLTTAF